MTDLCKNILLEQSYMARMYVESQRAHTTPKRARKLKAGLFGVVKGDSVTYQDESGTVTTKKLSEV
jgi:hypothetical protein